MLYDNSTPRYLPHIPHPEVLLMGLSPKGDAPWIEPDNDIGRYHEHKLQQRKIRGDAVYRGDDESIPAQRELRAALTTHLLDAHADCYSREADSLNCRPGDFQIPLAGEECLWDISLAVADDLAIMEKRSSQYHLTAASLCSPSHWLLAEKVGLAMRDIHDPIPGFHEKLTPRIDRFFEHLRPNHPVVRFNWSVLAEDNLAQLPGEEATVTADTPLFYRVERQSLVRLPETGAIAFSIRVYVHPLDMLASTKGAIPSLLAAIDAASPEISIYKGFDLMQPALARYRGR
ncbi:DUF3445 domain-containing protein [Halioglobus maricola]|uniref:DUF3445 domain-containing protein n=1 Tax=Halioglobus maricola TaxID=2601894 RepID=A0A5P9NJ17_9GAMM|nr:DUF3445 domain-containing protein [Halioglobus maricola]QFU75214.1 DUF3445 domain-containing protein [Halioglobus maricola]